MLKVFHIISFILLVTIQIISPLFTLTAQEVSKEYTYKHYTIHEGLAQMQVMSLYQDSRGFLWCNTKAGLSRFDGRSFKNITEEVTLPGFDITTMGESNRGNLILFGATHFRKLCKGNSTLKPYGSGVVTQSYYPHSVQKKLKVVSLRNRAGELIQKVLDYSNPDSLSFYSVNDEFGQIIHIEEKKQNRIWQSNSDSIYLSDLPSGKVIKVIENKFDIEQIQEWDNDYIAIGKDYVVYSLRNYSLQKLFQIDSADRFIKIIQTPSKDALVIKTDKDLLYFKDKLITIKTELTQIRDILFDYESNLWVATEEGLYNFFQLNFVNYTFGMGNKDWVWSVLEDAEKNIWFGSYQNGLWKYDGKTIRNYTTLLNSQLKTHLSRKQVPKQYRYYMGASKMRETLFFPTECNVLRYKANSFLPVKGLPELPFQITKTYPDSTLYCGGYPGLFEIDKNHNIRSWHRDSIGISSVLNVERDRKKQLVAVGKNGIAVINNSKVKHYKQKPFLYQYCCTKDHKSNIWTAGLKNINLYTTDTILNVAQKNGEAFYSMLFVEPHYLFLGGLKGLYLSNLAEYYDSGEFEAILFNQNNGFTGIECGQNGFTTDSEGMVWLPTSDLVTRFNPQNLINKKIEPPRIFLSSEVSQDNIHWTKKDLSKVNKLNYKHNNLRFNVNAIYFGNSGTLRYYYKLEGLQNNWSAPSEIDEITFYELDPGKYKLHVKADSGIKKASSEILTINFQIKNPFWSTWWFVVLSCIAIVFITYLLIKYYTLRERKKAAIKQRLVQLRSEALSAQLDPHFVMNCLNNISGLVNAGYKEKANNYIVKFSKLLRVILQSVKKEAISLREELDMVQKYMELEQFRCNNCFAFTIQTPENYSSENIFVPPMILQPLVENSIKHGFGLNKIKEALISIEITTINETLVFCICDNGNGLKNNSDTGGTGIGTRITQERIKLLQKGGKLHFHIKEIHPGVEVRFEMPLVIKHSEK